jgi:fimbrial isopeptide formation D2 family protein/LPXTG-motif cell wall-anchored protein
MKKSKNYKKLMVTLAATTMLLPLTTVPTLFVGNATIAYAEESTAPTVQNLTIQKVMYTGAKPDINNTGEIISSLPTGVTKYQPQKYGDVEFTVVNITEFVQGKTKGEVQTILNNLTQENYSEWINTNRTTVHGSGIAKALVNSEGTAVVNGLKTASGGHNSVFAVFETKSSKGLIGQIAQPMVITLPIQNTAGDGFNSNVYVYPKNEVKDLELELVKYSEKIAAGNKLAGAEFDVYRGTPGSGTKMNTAPLISNANGSVKVTGLTIGDYYLVETKAPAEHAISGSALNNTNNKLTFSIGANGVDESTLHIDYINYKKPKSEKLVENGTAPQTNESSFNIGDAVEYSNIINVPTDINGGSLMNIGSEKTTLPYHIFNYTDKPGKGLTYYGTKKPTNKVTNTGTNAGITVAGKDKDDKAVTLALGTDYTYKDIEENGKVTGFTIDFIMTNGKVSDNVAKLAGGSIRIDYTMILNEEAEVGSATGLLNHYDLAWNNDPTSNADTDTKHEEGEVPVHTGGAKFEKEDSSTRTKLAGAEFVLIKEGKYFAGFTEDTDQDGIKEAKWVTAIADAQKLTSGSDGSFEVAGLEYGTYSLKEVKAPSGYALLTTTKDFTISKDTYVGTVATITNTKQSELPITGSTQLIIAVVGGVLMVTVAGIYFKKRQEA